MHSPTLADPGFSQHVTTICLTMLIEQMGWFVCLCGCLTFLDITERCRVLKLFYFCHAVFLFWQYFGFSSKRLWKGGASTLHVDPSFLGLIEDTHRFMFRTQKLKICNSTDGSNVAFPLLLWDTGGWWRHTCVENWGWFIYCQTHQDCKVRRKLG